MLEFLKNHPFAVESFFDTSLVLTYAVPKEHLQSMIPPCLTLDTWKDEWGFVAVAMVSTKNLRPKGFPEFMGSDFILTGYRIFVRYVTNKGKRLRGLYIIRSETNQSKMTFFGNIFTHYHYRTTDLVMRKTGDLIEVKSDQSDLDVLVKLHGNDVTLPAHSPFLDWKEARRFAGPLPFTFTFNEAKKEVLIIEGVREDWTPRPVEVLNDKSAFIRDLQLQGIVLANAFVISDIPYYWKKGRKDLWNPR